MSARLNPVVSPPPPSVSPSGGQQPDLSHVNNSTLCHNSGNPTISTLQTSLPYVIPSPGNNRPQLQSNPMVASNVIDRAFAGRSHVINPGSLMSASVQSRPDNNPPMRQNNLAVSQTNPAVVSQQQTNCSNQHNQLIGGQGKFACLVFFLSFYFIQSCSLTLTISDLLKNTKSDLAPKRWNLILRINSLGLIHFLIQF